MKVKKLIVDYEYDFELYGLTTSLKDYKVAWLINQQINIRLTRSKDYHLEYSSGEVNIINYSYQRTYSELRLFMNKAAYEEDSVQSYMVDEMKHFDYFIQVKGIIHTFTAADLLQELRAIEGVQLINQIDIEKLKSIDHFIF